jgi:hypothetical protein
MARDKRELTPGLRASLEADESIVRSPSYFTTDGRPVGSRIHIPQEQGGPGTEVPLRRVLRWRYTRPPAQGERKFLTILGLALRPLGSVAEEVEEGRALRAMVASEVTRRREQSRAATHFSRSFSGLTQAWLWGLLSL